ncbi:hypothetical protein SEA_KEELAN_86 [Gordonia phage Keelan]|nr:hypothetical protein SEA_KEELAN_86 [Gordonia phage Keelan]
MMLAIPKIRVTKKRIKVFGWAALVLMALSCPTYFFWFLITFDEVNSHDIPTYLEALMFPAFLGVVIGGSALIVYLITAFPTRLGRWWRGLPEE